MAKLARAWVGLAVGLGVTMAAACGSEESSEFGEDAGSSGTLGGEGGTGPGFGNDGGGVAPRDAAPFDAAACKASIDMYVMFDRSGSMGEDCALGDTVGSKWCRGVNALSGYFNSAGAAGHAAALQFFPLDSHDRKQCQSGDAYKDPVVPQAGAGAFLTLPTTAFDAKLGSESPTPNHGTPTEAAIRGLTRFTSANRRPGHVTIGILVTDGDPNGCEQGLDKLSALLDAHYQATKVRTYVIGMQGASFAKLERVAKGGGTPAHPDAVSGVTDACGDGAGPCHHWNVGDGDPKVFAAALAAIQESADGCKDGGAIINPVN